MEDKGFEKPYDLGLCFHKLLRKVFVCLFVFGKLMLIILFKKKLATFKFIYSVHTQVHRFMCATTYV